MKVADWRVGDIVCMYFETVSGACQVPTVGLITAPGKEKDCWKVMYESEWGVRTAELPALIFYRTEQEGEKTTNKLEHFTPD